MQVRKVQILKHPNGKSPNWYVRYWVLAPGNDRWREKWISTRTTIKRDAEEFRRKLERELERKRDPHAEKTWAEFVSEFLEKQAPRQRPSTHQAYQTCLNAFTTTSNPELLTDVNVGMLEDFGNSRLSKGIAAATVNRDLRHLKAALNWAERKKYIVEAPDFKGVFIRVDRKDPVVMPQEDFEAIVKATFNPAVKLSQRSPEWWRVFLYVAYYLGLRRGEMLRLTWDCVSFEHMAVKVSAESKSRAERTLPLHPTLADFLRGWKTSQLAKGGGPEVLPWPFQAYRQLYFDWHALQTAAGIKAGEHYVPKNLRSTCASELIRAGQPTVVVKDFLGHSGVTTTENYYINTSPAMRAAADAREIKILDQDSVD